jgi:two-component system response regulator AdeR
MVAWKTEADTLPLHTVLIISDQPRTVAVWETLFSEQNCIVLPEGNIHDALQTARLLAPSLMLVDVKLSKSEGISLLTSLREASRGPILMLVSADTVQEVLEASQAGADEYLVKPVNPAVLVVKAMTWLGHGQRSKRASPALNVNVST